MKKILVADDEQVILKVIQEELTNEGYQVDLAADGAKTCECIKTKSYDVVILDVRMPKIDGISVLKEIKSIAPDTVVIMMTAFGTINNAVEAMKIGAYDYLTKPFDNNDLLIKIRQALIIKEKMSAVDIGALEDNPELVGVSKEINRLKAQIQKVTNLDTIVLITGESGTGKGVMAKAIHDAGARRHLPFLHVNCAALPANLIESELFGHEKGAFTGALECKKGKFELAGKGTLFLDEIGILAPNLQAKLLIVLQDKKVERVGGVKTLPVEARIIAATNINLEEAVRLKEFREDLFYRLNVVTIECPPLRYRKEDIEPLTTYFLQKLNKKLNKKISTISPEVWRIFNSYEWPGNVRELENTLESAIALSSGTTLGEEDLPLRIGRKAAQEHYNKENESGILKAQEIEAIKRALDKHNGHREKAARELGISRRTLQYKLNRFELRA